MRRARAAAGAGFAAAWLLVGWAAPAASPRGAGTCTLSWSSRAAGSRTCLSCHDGSLAHAALPARAAAGEPLSNHPVAIDYEAARERDPRLRPAAQLPPEIRLVEGRLECTTCHDPRSTLPASTALPMRGSQLCFACHDL
ncbi:cytochrome c3 family protein [Anaeromyxobacter paludicola]|uniref:Doubled CXXCH motif domain-containing protein n=1 Tax=Anaeromyxobacter paludicola TaxID=2918171 RepID=A0ABM7XAA5_9BACT|nr:cytochrome c3 family protein [Anaeromyxobacter paludicola]BDG08783.1 hypothetical protein AMPC_18960 [Anaeromyxobacter paludicola]